MPEVERNELMIPITEWVINEALRQLQEWRDEGYDLTHGGQRRRSLPGDGSGLFETVDAADRDLGHPAGEARPSS